MGVVWEAVEIATRRRVAVKLIRPDLLQTGLLRRQFAQEVELAARLEHPLIGRIYHAGVEGDRCYFVMELVEGLPLDRYAWTHRLDEREMVTLAVRVCRAVQHCHACKVVHRDLKPSNVLVTVAGEPRILDFGLARALDASGMDSVTLTAIVGPDISGTLAYMAPEQAAGGSGSANTAVDVCALGVMLYQMLSRKLPRDVNGPWLQALRRVAQEPARPLSDALPGADPQLEAVLAKAMALDATDRYTDAGEFADDLDRLLAGRATRASRRSQLAQAYGWCRRPERVVGAGATQLAVSVVGALFHLLYSVAVVLELALNIQPLIHTPYERGPFLIWNLLAAALYLAWAAFGRRVACGGRRAAWIGLIWSAQQTSFNILMWAGVWRIDIGGALAVGSARSVAFAMFGLLSATVMVCNTIALLAIYRGPLAKR